jgi:putative endonuclease
MWFSRKQVGTSPRQEALPAQPNTKRLGDAAEAVALGFLQKAGLRLVEANYRTPGRGGGEFDLVMREADGTLVFVEVRQRRSESHGGAGASIGAGKQQRVVLAARHYLLRFASPPPCRFDVVLLSGDIGHGVQANIEWLRAAFDAS